MENIETKKLFENFKLLNSDFNLNEATFTDTFGAGNQTNTTPTQPTTKPQNQPSDVANLNKRTTSATAVQKAASRINTVNEFSGAFKNWFSSLGYKPDNNAISIGKTVSLIRAAMTEMGYK